MGQNLGHGITAWSPSAAPEYQGRLVSPGVKVGDKPAGYAPAVRNWAPESRG
ncbi:hypothetical protein [Nonomuraea sp. NPDC049695]|uniref:hypothetical protein n=1 Tax=Nonomuraea sp. NPDC049695 TaxID=3154734 RepID=UPI0034161583